MRCSALVLILLATFANTSHAPSQFLDEPRNRIKGGPEMTSQSSPRVLSAARAILAIVRRRGARTRLLVDGEPCPSRPRSAPEQGGCGTMREGGERSCKFFVFHKRDTPSRETEGSGRRIDLERIPRQQFCKNVDAVSASSGMDDSSKRWRTLVGT